MRDDPQPSDDGNDRTDDDHYAGPLACPNCGTERFGWTVERVQSGEVHQGDSGARWEHATKSEEIVGGSGDVMCRGCAHTFETDELVALSEAPSEGPDEIPTPREAGE